MKNSTKDIIFTNDLVDDLMRQFSENDTQFARLSSPLSNVNFNESDEQN